MDESLAIVDLARIDAVTQGIAISRNSTGNWGYELPYTVEELNSMCVEKMNPEILKLVDTCILCNGFGQEKQSYEIYENIRTGRRSRPRQVIDFLKMNISVFIGQHLAPEHNIFAVTAQCATALKAIELAQSLIVHRDSMVLIASYEKANNPVTSHQFNSLSALNSDPEYHGPFDQQRNGLILGDGAAYLVLCSVQRAKDLGLTPRAIVRSVGSITTSSHATRPSDNPVVLNLLQRVIAQSGCDLDEFAYWNAHGTGTELNDASELELLDTIFGHRPIAISSYKSHAGHTMTASAAVEIAAGIDYLSRGEIYPNLFVKNSINNDPRINTQVTSTDRRTFLKTSFGFGGRNSAAVITVL